MNRSSFIKDYSSLVKELFLSCKTPFCSIAVSKTLLSLYIFYVRTICLTSALSIGFPDFRLLFPVPKKNRKALLLLQGNRYPLHRPSHTGNAWKAEEVRYPPYLMPPGCSRYSPMWTPPAYPNGLRNSGKAPSPFHRSS